MSKRRRGLNLGNSLDAADGRGLELAPWMFEEIRRAGFTTVRVPVCWSAHADVAPPYEIDGEFCRRVDRALDLAEQHDLAAIVDIHHYRELMESPGDHEDRFISLWQQIATRYAARPRSLSFELLNEPSATMDSTRWNILLQRAWRIVRETNPTREVIIGSADMNDLRRLPELELPNDPNITATIHYYAPMAFTHQGATWVDYPIGRSWGAREEVQAVRDDLVRATSLADRAGVSLLVGEFGTYDRAPLADRIQWTSTVTAELDRLGIDWCYWDFATDFGVYDLACNTWREPLLAALLPGR